MSESQTSSASAGIAALSAVASPEALENLAARVRRAGLFLMVLRPDGGVIYSDPAAGDLFQRYVLPQVRLADDGPCQSIGEKLRQITAASDIATWNCIPGVLLAAAPFIEKKQLAGVMLLAARSAGFEGNPDVAAVCDRLDLDQQQVSRQAGELSVHDENTLSQQARLLLAMVRDQFQLTQLQSELDSLSHQLSNTYEELSLIYQISGGMKINRRADEFFKQACLDVMEVMGVKGMGIVLCGEHAERWRPMLYGRLNLPPGTVQRLTDELTPLLSLRKSTFQTNNLAADGTFSWLSGYVKQLLAVPMQRQEKVLGYYFALEKNRGEFDSQDSKLLTSIANETAIFLENAILFDDVHGLMMGLLHSLTSAVDAKDAYTHGHSERVAAVARQLAMEAGLGEALTERIYMAGLLHDVGKIGVPESVLHKTGRLTPEEFEQMKKHPQIGARILADVKQVSDLIPGVLHHHERYDGNGYPACLAGERIPLMGRVICLADCFDAMTSNRTYRKAMPLEVALMEIRRCSGTQFDPGLTEAFLRIGADKLRQLVAPEQRLDEAGGMLGAA